MTRPLLRFAVLGTLLFLGFGAGEPMRSPERLPATASDDEVLLREALARGYPRSDPIVRRRLARNLRFARAGASDASESELVEEALALGMHESDLVARRRLVQKVQLEIAAAARRVEPTDAELGAYLAEHAARYTEPERIHLSQRFFRSRERAARALDKIDGTAPAAPEGDALPLPRELRAASRRELAARFGPAFASGAWETPTGAWNGPVPSSYGAHLVYVHGRTPARLSPLETVRAAVRESLLAERAERALARELAVLRARHSDADGASS